MDFRRGPQWLSRATESRNRASEDAEDVGAHVDTQTGT